jgi:hypothetical protein
MTNEQRIRGADAAVDWALVLTGYGEHALATLARSESLEAQLARRGASGTHAGLYQLAYSLDAREMAAASIGTSGPSVSDHRQMP